MDIALPFGAFQIQLPSRHIIDTVRHLQELLEKFYTLWKSTFDENTGEPEDLSKAIQDITKGPINQEIKQASEKVEESFQISEFPDVLPTITKQLIFASVVAQALHLSFEVLDYELNSEDKGRSYWWVTGRIKDEYGRTEEGHGTSFMFENNDEKMAEGALLSACADTFIYCVHSVFPYFPWDRWNEAWNAGLTNI